MTRRPRSRKLLTPRRLRLLLLWSLLLLSAFALYLDQVVRTEFEGKRWALPARVYARPLELYPGERLRPETLAAELALLHYRATSPPQDPGSYARAGDDFEIVTRPFVFWDGAQPPLHLRLALAGGRLRSLENAETGAAVTLARLDPLLIGGIYPSHNEDRILVKLDQVPPDLVHGLIAVEDRRFYSHHGVDPRGVARAIVAALRGRAIQGGSTLTQQLVKNFFLTPKRTLTRKGTEMLMALLLEMHYSKDQILETYINEVYLAQDGNRAIHGFGLASQFYFDRPLSQLTLAQSALLVGLVKGPSYYDPRRHPDRALARRNLVLAQMRDQNDISPAQYAAAAATPLGVTDQPVRGTSPYPAFLELVHRQLRRDYRDQDLRSEGLQIFTTLDPEVQRAAEQALAARLARLEQRQRLPAGTLEGAVVVASTQNGEVQAVVGGRDARYEGYNRALDAQRQIGSLIKPAIYLTALEQPAQYTLVTPLEDAPLVVHERGTKDWSPHNYDRTFRGEVPLNLALADSLNVPTVRLGLALGVPRVMDTAHRLGIDSDLPAYGSSLLGADNLTPIEVTQMYETLASGGFRVPLRAIREVLTADGRPLQHFPLAVDQVAPPAAVYLLTAAMQGVVREGTAEGLSRYLPSDLHVAGKTGTTDDLRDSWFAGFTGDRVAVAWVGRDDNGPTGLTGASGAMTVWGDMMARLDPEPLAPPRPENIEEVWIDPATRLRADQGCPGAVRLPFIRGSAPTQDAPCVSHSPIKAVKGWFKRLFER